MAQQRRFGFTLLEMMLSVTIMLLVFAIAIPFFRVQLQAMDSHAGRFEAQQNARFGSATIDRELRVAGAGLPDAQPMVVQAATTAITFNADLASTISGSVTAVYTDPDLPLAATSSMTTSAQISLPVSGASYPLANYSAGVVPSPAETISFYVIADTGAGSEPGTYALFRRVNSLPATIVARRLVMRAGDPPPFTYYYVNGEGKPTAIPTDKLPIVHVAQHGAMNDTGVKALTDSIRLVKIHLVGRTIGQQGDTSYRTVDMSVRLMNAGLLHHTTCGDAPIFSQTVAATYVAGSSPSQVRVTWTAALDETSGEKDVERYLILRRAPAATTFGDPLAIIPAGQGSYQFVDLPGSGDWVYGVAAQDCGAQNSTPSLAASVNVP